MTAEKEKRVSDLNLAYIEKYTWVMERSFKGNFYGFLLFVSDSLYIARYVKIQVYDMISQYNL